MNPLFKKGLAGCLAALLLVSSVTALGAPSPVQGADQSFASDFASPPSAARPKTRWWVPGSHMTKEEIEKEIASMAQAGFGGAEVVPVATGGEGGSSIDWGTEQWNEMIKHMLQVAGKYDFTIDFTMTPAWPLALPTITDVDDPSQGAQMEADGAHVDGITKDSPYSGPVPVASELDAGTPELLAVTVAKYADKETKTLDYDSARTLEMGREVVKSGDGPTDYTVSFAPEDAGEYVLFGWWQHPSGNQKYGNYQLDHFGRAGAQALIDYWENNLLPYYGEDFKNASALFIDSLEFETHLDWTIGLLDEFQAAKQYDLSAYLPAVYDTDSSGNFSGDPKPDFQFDKQNEELKNDYKDLLTQLYIQNHLEPLSAFCDKIGVDLRYQTSYGKSLELAQTAMYVDIPETETLYGKDIIDFYRLQSGAVHLTDKEIYSVEASPEQNISINFGSFVYNLFRGNGEDGAGNYQQTWEDQLWHVQRAMAGGVNQIVFHGYSYNGQYEGEGNENGFVAGTSWPGFEGFGQSSWSNSWGERLPSWQHARDYTDYIARNQYLLRQGTAKVDVAIYHHSYWENIDFSGADKVYKDGGALGQNGYTYEFVSPAGLSLDNAVVTDGRLDESGPAYKALVFDSETSLPGETADRLLEYAQAGFPLLFVGGMPDQDAYGEQADIASKMEQLAAYSSVRIVDTAEQVVDALKELGISPDASFEQPQNLLSVHRALDNADLYYLYNEGGADNYPAAKQIPDVNTKITLKGNGKPYLLNTWTGEITPIASYTAQNGTVTIDAVIGGNDSMAVAIAPESWYQGSAVVDSHVVSGGLQTSYAQDGSLIAKSFEPGTQQVTLDNGEVVPVVTGEVPAEIPLTNWELTVESWSEGATPAESQKTNIDFGTIDGLRPWNQLEGLEKVSGIGRYTTTVQLENGWQQGTGAVIELGDVVDTYRITVNGTTLTTNQIDTTLDIGPWLKAGENIITVEVASTLLNAMLASNPADTRSPDEYGMLSPVTLTPYVWTTVVGAQESDKGILQKVIAYAQQQRQDPSFDHVIEMVQQSFVAALETAQAVERDAAASQDEVDSAWQALMTEIHKLGFVRGDKTSLQQLIQLADTFLAQIDRYTPVTAQPFTAALTEAKAVYQDGNAMQEDVAEAESALLDAMLGLRYRADKSVLREVLSRADGIDTARYTADRVAAFRAAYDAAKAVSENANATQTEVDSAADELQRAIDSLVEIATEPDQAAAEDALIHGDSASITKSQNSKTGDAAPVCAALAALLLAGAGLALNKKKR